MHDESRTTRRLRVLVLAGGPDAEREVSLTSGRAVAEALRIDGTFEVVYHEIERLDAEQLARIDFDVAFPVLHGPWGEGGPLQEILEADGRPFVGSGSKASALAMDKIATKQVAERLGIPTPPAALLCAPGDACPIAPPLVFKPVDDGSSVDIFICRSRDEADAARAQMHARRTRFMAEAFIPGRELTVGMIEGRVSSVIEIVPSVAFYDYEAKYLRDDTAYKVDPDLPEHIRTEIVEASLRLHEAMGLRDLARLDFRYDPDAGSPTAGLWMLEVNTIPGFTSHSLVPMGAAAAGEEMPALCRRLTLAALRRGAASCV